MKTCSICQTTTTSRWWSNSRCNSCALKEKRRSQGILPRNKNFDKKQYKAAWYQKNKQRIKDKLLQKYPPKEKTKKSKEEIRKRQDNWNKNNKDRVLASKRKYAKNNQELCKQSSKRWKQQNKGIVNYHTNKRRARTKLQTPKWANQELIKEIYKNCPEGYDVDHIIPLQGENVCGLHVEYNLQHLSRKENQQKSNKLLISYLNNETENK